MDHPFQNRLSYSGPIKDLLLLVSADFDLGEYHTHSVVDVGYEDLNVALTTHKGQYLVKFFAKFREKKDCERYAEILEAVSNSDVSHPQIHRSSQGILHRLDIDDQSIFLVVMNWIEGQTFYQAKIKPNNSETIQIVHEAAKINQLQINPSFIYDSWATYNFKKEYQKVKNLLDEKFINLIDNVADDFELLNLEKLPKAFVHGDLIDTNVIRDQQGKIFILDFSVANIYPRIQDLAVLLCDIFFDPDNTNDFAATYELVLKTYQEKIPLTSYELSSLPTYIKAAHAMHIIGAHKIIHEGHDSEENQYWLKMGVEGIKFSLQHFSELKN